MKLLKHTLLMTISFAMIGAGLTYFDVNVAETIKSGLDVMNPNWAESAGLTSKFITEHLATNNTLWTGAFFGMFGAASVLVPTAIGKATGLSEKEEKVKVNVRNGKELQVSVAKENEVENGLDFTNEQMGSHYTAKIQMDRASAECPSVRI